MLYEILGDANNDGRIDLMDVPFMLKVATGTYEDENSSVRCDVDKDGTVSTRDIQALIKHLNGEELISEVIYIG